MLACDLILQVRASRYVSGDQVRDLERLVFRGGKPGRDEMEMLHLIDSYAQRADPNWAKLLARASVKTTGSTAEALPGLAA